MNVAAHSPPWPAYTVVRKPMVWLKPYAKNARTHSKAQIEQIRGSLRQFGWTIPVLAREDGTIIAGHGRIEAGKLEGITEVPVIIATGWTETQCRAYALADNRVALNSGWDEQLLGAELGELSGLGVDLGTLGFDELELDTLLGNGGHTGLTDPDEAPEPPVNPVARVGDLWALGRHRLLCGDATKAEDTQKVLRGVSPHLMVTDPPYGVEYDATWRDNKGEFAQRGFAPGKVTMRGVVNNDTRADWREVWTLFPGDVAYVWCASLHTDTAIVSLEAAGFERRSQIIWAKQHLAISRGHYHWQHEPCWYAVRKNKTGSWQGDRKQTTLWQIENLNPVGRKGNEGFGADEKLGHSTQKPVECMKRPIENNSSPGQAVYDPFVGSGTTIIAAEMTGRSCHAIEIDPAYIDVCVKRWQDFTGEKATLDGDGRSFEEIAAERLTEPAVSRSDTHEIA